MSYVLFRDIFKSPEKYAGQTIKVAGWVRTIRASKAFGFIELNDGTHYKNIQVVFEQDLKNFDEIAKFTIASSILVEAEFVLTPDAKQPFEFKAKSIQLEGGSDKDYPLQKKRHTFEYMRTIAHLRPRANTFNAVFRVRSVAAFALHKFFNEKGFVYTHTPIITGADCEGAGEMFKVTTMDLASVPKTKEGEIYYKKENTPRHAAEFWMIEPEIAFADLNDDMNLAEEMLKYLINYVMEECPAELEFFDQRVDKGLLERLRHVANSDFARVTYTEAVEILEKADKEFEYPVSWGIDLQTEHERYLTEEVYKKPVFVTDYPKDIKAFYMRMNDDGKTVAATDLLVPGVGELIGGSQREERYDVLIARIKEMGLNEEDYWWYLDMRRYGGTKHAGFGLGFERAIMYLTGMKNIRDVIPFPRTTNQADF